MPQFRADGPFLAVEFDDEVRAAAGQESAAGSLLSGSERKGIGDFQRAGQDAGGKNRPDGAGRVLQGAKSDAEAGAERRPGQQLERRFGHDPEQSFRADEKAS